MSFNAGESVGPYRVIEQLGQGGMATVFKAYHAALDRYVALKVLHPAFMQDPNFLARFQREAQVVAKLEHPNIIPVYDFAEHNGHPYLVMKFIEGETLKARLSANPLAEGEGFHIIQTVGKALSFAHEQGILHRDIKPSNVMIANDGQVYLADFGLARIASAGESTLSSDMMLGTPQYISPEQAVGKRQLDEGTDIYSFGVLIYELVVGQVPFSADTPFSIVHDHIYSPLPLPRAINPNVPEAVERILMKALAKERTDRFENVASLVKAFKDAMGDAAPSDVWAQHAAPSSQPLATLPLEVSGSQAQRAEDATLPAEKPTRKWRWWYALPIVLGLCVCFLVLVNARDKDRPAVPKDPVTTPLNEAPPQRSTPLPPPKNNDNPPHAQDLDAALQETEDHPDDPIVWLNLAAAYLDLGWEDDAFDAFSLAEDLADDDPEFYSIAGDMLASRQLWLLALEQYIQVIEIAEDHDQSPQFINKLRQAVYMAAQDPQAQEILFTPIPEREMAVLERYQLPAVLEVAKARYMLFFGDPDEAASIIQRVLSRAPDLPEALLVQAELMLAEDHASEAIPVLEGLLEGRTPPWVQVEARRILNEIGS